MVSFNGDDFYLNELEVIQDDSEKTLYDEFDEVYWANMKHQYAGRAMQAYIIASNIGHFSFCENDVAYCESMANALVEKLKKSYIHETE